MSGSGEGSGSKEEEGDVESPSGYTEGGFHPVQLNERFDNGRFVVTSKLGFGHFSTVWRAVDTSSASLGADSSQPHRSHEHCDVVALKVQKSAPQHTEAARDEVALLRRVAEREGPGKEFVVQLIASFEHSGPNGTHVCIVTEALGDNLLTLIRRYNHRGLPLLPAARLGRQMLSGLAYLHDVCGIIHTDLKPENILTSSLLPELLCNGNHQDQQTNHYNDRGENNHSQQMHVDEPPSSTNKRSELDEPQTSGQNFSKSRAKASRTLAQHSQREPPVSDESPENTGSTGGETNDRLHRKSSASKSRSRSKERGDHHGVQKSSFDERPSRRERESRQRKRSKEGVPNAPLENAGTKRPAPLQEGDHDSAGLTSEYLERISCKIVDLGNACWVEKHFTSDIQTRQYRAPEVFLGYEFGIASDVWSAACILFELVTGDLLFTPADGKGHGKEDDHLAMMMELLGKIPKPLALGGKRSREFFNKHGELKRIRKLDYWPLNEVLMEKYNLPGNTAECLKNLLESMMAYVPEKRSSASEALQHPFFSDPTGSHWRAQQNVQCQEGWRLKRRTSSNSGSGKPERRGGGDRDR